MAPKDTDAIEHRSDTPSTKAMVDGPAASEPPAPGNRMRRYVGIGLLALIGPLAAVLLGVYIYLSGGRYVSTDNAYVKSAKIVVSADVSGRVVDVAVRENETVAAGALLFRINPASFQMAVEQADARRIAAGQRVEALRAIYKQKLASQVRAKSEVTFHIQQYNRQKELSRRKLVSGLNLDTASRNLRDARDQVNVAEQELAEARANLGGDPAIAVQLHPDVLEAKAVRDRAALDLKNTQVHASMRGIVTNFDLQPGEYVRAGMPVFSMVGADTAWVHANYKETELTHVRVGQRATITVDTYPGETFEATVTGISPATGAEFALLPPQNATGNWVKVVQRLTVRLKLSEPADGPKLRAGMSAIVEIDTEHQRKLGGVFAIVADWASGLTKGLL